LRGQRIFITGGTGFFGRWLLESFAWANTRLDLKAEVVVLTRNPAAFAKKAPQLAANPAIQLHVGDVRDFIFPPGRFSHVIHGATDASVKLNQENPLLMFDTIVEGTRRTLELAAAAGARKFLFISSGAVYGKQPPELSHIPEDFVGAHDPTNPLSSYGEGKRAGEMLAAILARQHGFEAKIARAFTFVVPHLPLDGHFAVGSNISQVQFSFLFGEPLVDLNVKYRCQDHGFFIPRKIKWAGTKPYCPECNKPLEVKSTTQEV